MLTADNQKFTLKSDKQEQKSFVGGKRNSRLAIDIHSMPKTSEKSHRAWFVLGGLAILAVIGLILILLI